MRLLKLVLCAAIAAPSGLALSPVQCSKTVAIGAWNISWLGNPISGKRAAHDAVDINSYIAAAGVDVLALSEIAVRT